MRAVIAARPGGPDVLTVVERPRPVPGPGEVLVRVAAAGVNRADAVQRAGHYPPPPGASDVLGLECAGKIVELGEGVRDRRVGERVCALLSAGGYAEFVTVPAGQVAPVPNGLSMIEAASVMETAATVWSNIFWVGGLDRGDTFLVHGGSSGVGTMAIQLAAAAGARVVMAGERRRQASHPPRTRPELVATAPGQVWSWDITKLKGPERGVYYDLYVVLDIFSRFVVGWTIAAREDAEIAKNLLEHAMGIHGVPEAIHADRGTSMTSKPVAQLLVDLGVARSHSRPHVSNDNPYSEAAFKTLKYAPVFPERFGSLADAGAFAEQFFAYYNHEHRHCGIGLHTPASVHFGTAGQVRAQRQATLDAAYAARPERFGHRRPQAPKLPEAAWINQPSQEALIQTA